LPVRGRKTQFGFFFQAEAILEETGIHVARWVTVLAPQLKIQAGTW